MKTTLIVSLLALAAVGAASAQSRNSLRRDSGPITDQAVPTKIYITGSTAFRAATTAAITTVVGVSPTSWDGNSGGVTSASNANAVTWTGGSISGTPVTIKASWSGSGAGVQTVAGSLNVRFLPDSAVVGGPGNSDPRNTSNPAEVAIPDVAMSDVFQAATQFNRTFLGVTYNNLTDQTVGVVTFKFVASNGFPGNNITSTQAQQLWSAGFAPLALFTGNATGNGTVRSGDQLKVVYATGRNPDSGTRVTAFADTGVGALATVKQYKATVNGSAQVTALALYPIETINGVSTGSAGNSGESSGGSLRAFMPNTLLQSAYQTEDASATGGYLITYLGVNDANTVLTGGSGAGTNPAVELAFNGVAFSEQSTEQGNYGFWGYEHVDYRSTLGGIQKTFGDNLANTISATPTSTLRPNGIALGDMAVQRGGDGTPIGPNYL